MMSIDRYAVIGQPVAHSQSPFIHAAFAESTGQQLHYDRLPAPLDGFEATVRRFMAEGARGCNVTVPFKRQAFRLAVHATERAVLAEAANTLLFDVDANGWQADNTDGAGLVRDIEVNAGVSIAGRRVLLIGAGGAAAGALGPLLQARPAQVVVANRTQATAETLVERHRRVAGDARLDATSLAEAGYDFDIVINASASSLAGSAVPVPDHTLRAGGLALDMMYGAAAQPFLAWATSLSATSRDGLGMLVEQAAEAFFVWRGIRPETASVLQALRARMGAAA